MAHAAQILKEEQYLTIADLLAGNPSQDLFAKQENLINDDLITNPLFKKVAPFYYKNRLRLFLAISDRHKAEFIMIRGLIEFHRPKAFNFHFNLKQRTIEADIEETQIEDLRGFLTNVNEWLKKEAQFRLALKIAIEFENRYKLERESIYDIMKKTAAAVSNG